MRSPKTSRKQTATLTKSSLTWRPVCLPTKSNHSAWSAMSKAPPNSCTPKSLCSKKSSFLLSTAITVASRTLKSNLVASLQTLASSTPTKCVTRQPSIDLSSSLNTQQSAFPSSTSRSHHKPKKAASTQQKDSLLAQSWVFRSFKRNEDALTQPLLLKLMSSLQSCKHTKKDTSCRLLLSCTILPGIASLKIHQLLKSTKTFNLRNSNGHCRTIK